MRTPITKEFDHLDLARWGLDRLGPRKRFEIDTVNRGMRTNRKTWEAAQGRTNQRGA
jgi:hypothetical protein